MEEHDFRESDFFEKTESSVPIQILIRFNMVCIMAALVGGIMWGAIALSTGYEISWMGIGIGALCGYIASLYLGIFRSVLLPFLATSYALAGWVLGKYFIYLYFFGKIQSIDGQTEVTLIDLLRYYMLEVSINEFPLFLRDYGSWLQIHDLFFAVVTASAAWYFSYINLHKSIKARKSQRTRRIKRLFD